MPIDKLVIDRQLWGRGALLKPDGTMCCLGFAALACGVPVNQLTFGIDGIISYPLNSWINVNEWMRDAKASPAAHALMAASINDGDDELSIKEEKLIKLFANNGVELSFIGEPRV